MSHVFTFLADYTTVNIAQGSPAKENSEKWESPKHASATYTRPLYDEVDEVDELDELDDSMTIESAGSHTGMFTGMAWAKHKDKGGCHLCTAGAPQ